MVKKEQFRCVGCAGCHHFFVNGAVKMTFFLEVIEIMCKFATKIIKNNKVMRQRHILVILLAFFRPQR